MRTLFFLIAIVVASTAGLADQNVIRKSCAAQWATDFQMQKYCVDQQTAAVKKLVSRIKSWGFWDESGAQVDKAKLEKSAQAGEPKGIILAKCLSEWASSKTTDYQMVEYCNKQQFEAYQALNR